MYPGDDQMRVCTQQNKRRREDDEEDDPTTARRRGRPSRDSNKKKRLTEAYKLAKEGRGECSRLCGNLQQLKKHIKSTKHSIKHPKICVVCGGPAYSMCTICGVYLHFNPKKGEHAGKMCFHDYHDDLYFGLARCDHKINDNKKNEWSNPSRAKERENEKKITDLTVEE